MKLPIEHLKQRQSLALESKVALTEHRIHEFLNGIEGDAYLSFSGGKDSTVLLDIIENMAWARECISVVYCDTGLDYPEARRFAIDHADEVIRPRLTFKQVIEKHGYPLVSKEQAQYIREIRQGSPKLREKRLNGKSYHIAKKWLYLLDAPFEISERCCLVMKKLPFEAYERRTGRKKIVATMADESRLRMNAYLLHGCNSFEAHPRSMPMGFWTEQDVLEYIRQHELPIAGCYGSIVEDGGQLRCTGVLRTGCMFCMFGVHLEGHPNRFEKMKDTHPKQYRYCMESLGLDRVLDYVGVEH